MPSIQKNTKILATIGPASSSFEMLLKLVTAGVDVFRLNFSHGSHEEHKAVIDNILRINQEYNQHVSILADLQGPKIRVGKIENDGFPLTPGQEITFTTEDCLGTPDRVYLSYEKFAKDVKVGERILADDGKVGFQVVHSDGEKDVKLRVLFGLRLGSNKGVNFPDTETSAPSLTKKDLEDLEFILTQPVNWIALSFVRRAKDVKDLKSRIEAKNHPAKVIAKIEKPSAVANIKKIIKVSNGIMIARGDLGVEMPLEQLPMIQKMIIDECITRSRPVIVATQMMDSMISNPSPTRAEVTDVANAVLDGTDAVMLSGETSVGLYPVETVEHMVRIILEAEPHYSLKGMRKFPSPESSTFLSDVVCANAVKTAEDISARAIVGMTVSGFTAFKISSYRPACKILIFSDRMDMLSTLALVWGVNCLFYNKFTSTDETIQDVIEIMKDLNEVKSGDLVVNTGAMPLGARGRTNMLKITEVE